MTPLIGKKKGKGTSFGELQVVMEGTKGVALIVEKSTNEYKISLPFWRVIGT